MRIVLTGSSSGIGRALAERLLSRGHAVWGLARSDQSELARLAPERFVHDRCDVASWPDVAAVAARISEHWPAVDAVVTCAGIQGTIGPATSVPPEAWSQTVRTNLDGTYFAIRALWPALLRTEARGKIVCFSGGGATKARPRFSAYGAAKTAVVRLVETIAVEEADAGIDINAVAPGMIHTRLTDELVALGPEIVGEAEHAAALQQQAAGDAALQRALDLVEWLLSPASNGISGRLLSAPWDPWPTLDQHTAALRESDIFTLRRIVPEDRNQSWS